MCWREIKKTETEQSTTESKRIFFLKIYFCFRMFVDKIKIKRNIKGKHTHTFAHKNKPLKTKKQPTICSQTIDDRGEFLLLMKNKKRKKKFIRNETESTKPDKRIRHSTCRFHIFCQAFSFILANGRMVFFYFSFCSSCLLYLFRYWNGFLVGKLDLCERYIKCRRYQFLLFRLFSRKFFLLFICIDFIPRMAWSLKRENLGCLLHESVFFLFVLLFFCCAANVHITVELCIPVKSPTERRTNGNNNNNARVLFVSKFTLHSIDTYRNEEGSVLLCGSVL